MAKYITNREVRYAGVTYRSGESIPVLGKDVRLLVAIGSIREAPREDRVAAYEPEEKAQEVPTQPELPAPSPVNEPEVTDLPSSTNNETLANAHSQHSDVDHLLENATEIFKDDFQVEDAPVPQEILDEEEKSETPQKRTYRNRRMKSEDE